jgi:hypothetical protein
VVVQAATSHLARFRSTEQQEHGDISKGTSPLAIRNSCHVWAEDGVAEQKLALGWQPGTDAYPAPTLVHFRERAAKGS